MLRTTASAAVFSSTRATLRVPGIGAMSVPWASNQASAIWAPADDPALVALVGQLSTRSQAFRTRWAAHDVRAHRAGAELFRHPLIGEITLPFEQDRRRRGGDPVLTVFDPQPGSPEHDAVQLPASWTARPSIRP